MSSIFDRKDPTGRKWQRGEQFRLSAAGLEAETRYQSVLLACRDVGGRAAFDEATTAWASALGLFPRDGAYLAELRESARSVVELVEALDDCGATVAEAKAALDRLLTTKLAEPAPRV